MGGFKAESKLGFNVPFLTSVLSHCDITVRPWPGFKKINEKLTTMFELSRCGSASTGVIFVFHLSHLLCRAICESTPK